MFGKVLITSLPVIIWIIHFFGNKGKGRTSKRRYQGNKARQNFRKTNISYPLIRTPTCAYQGVGNVRFSENLPCFVFLLPPFWNLLFCLISHEIYMKLIIIVFCHIHLFTKKKFKDSYFINTGLNLGLRKSFRKVFKCRYDNQTKQGPII